MKKFILLAALNCILSCTIAQNFDSLVEIKGIYVTSYLKHEIDSSYEQKIKEEKEEPFYTPIDYETYSFFVPIQVGENVYKNNEITKEFINRNKLNTDSVVLYVLPDRRSSGMYFLTKTTGIATTNMSREICIVNGFRGLSPDYKIDEDNEFLFCCVYIEGYAIHKHIQEIEKGRPLHDFLREYYFGENKEDLEFFFIVKINNYTTYMEIPGMKKWLPYDGNSSITF